MSEAEEVKLHIKVVINKEKTKVLFAEAGSDFTDVLLSFLLLPLGKIVDVLQKHYGDEAPVLGSLNTLYNGVANLDVIHFPGEYYKRLLLDPLRYVYFSKLRLDISHTKPTSSGSRKSYDGVFAKSAASFIISDDLRVLPNVEGSIINTLRTLDIALTDMDGAETRNVAFGLNEIMALLKESLISQSPLSALLFPQSRVSLAAEAHISLHQIDETVTSMNTKNMILKVMLQKSTSKLLFAQADCDFINFILGMLVICLGKIEWFLGSNTGLKNIDTMHRSVVDNSENMHMNSNAIDLLINASDTTTRYYVRKPNEFFELNFSTTENQNHVVGARMYMVTDDLTVAPLAITSFLSVLNELKISLSDVEELELHVGLEEGLCILKAALTSTTALTDGLIKPFLKKQNHQEIKPEPERSFYGV